MPTSALAPGFIDIFAWTDKQSLKVALFKLIDSFLKLELKPEASNVPKMEGALQAAMKLENWPDPDDETFKRNEKILSFNPRLVSNPRLKNILGTQFDEFIKYVKRSPYDVSGNTFSAAFIALLKNPNIEEIIGKEDFPELQDRLLKSAEGITGVEATIADLVRRKNQLLDVLIGNQILDKIFTTDEQRQRLAEILHKIENATRFTTNSPYLPPAAYDMFSNPQILLLGNDHLKEFLDYWPKALEEHAGNSITDHLIAQAALNLLSNIPLNQRMNAAQRQSLINVLEKTPEKRMGNEHLDLAFQLLSNTKSNLSVDQRQSVISFINKSHPDVMNKSILKATGTKEQIGNDLYSKRNELIQTVISDKKSHEAFVDLVCNPKLEEIVDSKNLTTLTSLLMTKLESLTPQETAMLGASPLIKRLTDNYDLNRLRKAVIDSLIELKYLYHDRHNSLTSEAVAINIFEPPLVRAENFFTPELSQPNRIIEMLGPWLNKVFTKIPENYVTVADPKALRENFLKYCPEAVRGQISAGLLTAA